MSSKPREEIAGLGSETRSAVPRTIETEADLDAVPTEDGSMAALLGAVAAAPAARPPVELAAGTVVDGTYRIVRGLGSGGMGVVYLARDLDLQRDVALKVHRAAHGLDRLQREAIAMAQLAHPNVLTVHGVGQVEGRLYIAMEYVPGETFRAWCEARRRTWREVLAMLLAAGEGLAAAHDAGFVHRDFKPENVLVGKDGRPRVGDFGLVRATTEGGAVTITPEPAPREDRSIAETLDDDAASSDAFAVTLDAGSSRSGRTPISAPLTVTGAALGTPAYMAPEQFAGGVVDARADQFAFCVVLYEALCGRRPYPGATYAELRVQVTRDDPAPLPRGVAPSWMARILRRGLARDPADRWPHLRALLAALRAAPRRRGLAIAGIAAATALAGGGAAVLAMPSRSLAVAPDCARAAVAVDDAWSPARVEAVRAHLATIDRAGYAERVVGRLDTYAQRLRAVSEEACRARADGTWTPRVSQHATTCLRGALGRFRSFVAIAGRLDAEQLPVFGSDLYSLPYVEDCADERVLAANFQLPADPAAAAEVRRLRGVLDTLEEGLSVGELPAGRARLVAAWPAIEALDFAPLTAEALLAEGLLLRGEQRHAEAIATLERAYATARAAGADATALDAAYWLIWVQGVDQRQVEKARPWVVQAVPEAERYGLDHLPASRVLSAAAVIAELDADYDRAIALHQRLVAAIEDRDDLVVAKSLGNLGASLDAAGRPAEAIAAYERALALFARDLGPDSPRTLWIRSNLILAHVAAGDPARGLAAAEEALALFTGKDQHEPQDLLNLRFNHAFALQSNGRIADAAAALAALRVDQIAASGEDTIDVAYIDANLGDLLILAGEPAKARPYLEHALALRIAAYGGEDHDEVADVLSNLGTVERKTRGCARAVGYYERAVAAVRAVHGRGGAQPRMAGPLIGLATCRLAAGRRDDAIALLTEARQHAGADATRVAEVDAALAAANR